MAREKITRSKHATTECNEEWQQKTGATPAFRARPAALAGITAWQGRSARPVFVATAAADWRERGRLAYA